MRDYANEQWECSNGERWEIQFVNYSTSDGFDNVYRLVRTYPSKYEKAHITEHCDSSGRVKQVNYHLDGSRVSYSFDLRDYIPSGCSRTN